MREDLESLAARVEALTEADREVDAEIAWTLTPERDRRVDDAGVRHIAVGWYYAEPNIFLPLSEADSRIERWTSDPAAPLRLIEQRWPALTPSMITWADEQVSFYLAATAMGRGQGPDLPGRLARAATAAALRLAARSAADGR